MHAVLHGLSDRRSHWVLHAQNIHITLPALKSHQPNSSQDSVTAERREPCHATCRVPPCPFFETTSPTPVHCTHTKMHMPWEAAIDAAAADQPAAGKKADVTAQACLEVKLPGMLTNARSTLVQPRTRLQACGKSIADTWHPGAHLIRKATSRRGRCVYCSQCWANALKRWSAFAGGSQTDNAE